MKIANTLSILLGTVLGIISAPWIFSPESAAQSLSMVYMEGDARNTQIRDFTYPLAKSSRENSSKESVLLRIASK